MKTLRLSCILPICLLAVLGAAQEGDFNYDESKVVPYTLPDPLLNADGTKVASARDLNNKRRKEILRLFETDVYGKSPARPGAVQFHINEVDTAADPRTRRRPPADAGHAWLGDALGRLEADLKTLIRATTIWREADELLRSVPGVGAVTSCTLIADLPEPGHLDRRRIAALAGLAPLARDSGAFRGRRMIVGGRAHVRRSLYMATVAAIKYNPVIRAFFHLSRSVIPLGLPSLDLHTSAQSTRRLSGRTMSLSPGVTMLLATALWTFLRALLFGSAAIALENLALRHQLVVLQRAVARPRLTRWDRIFWVWLSRLWASWRSSLVIVQPATVLAWHRKGFQLYWRWKSRANPVGRPRLDLEIRRLIRRMARENPTWGRRRIQAELALLGYNVAELTVAKYMRRSSSNHAPTWRALYSVRSE